MTQPATQSRSTAEEEAALFGDDTDVHEDVSEPSMPRQSGPALRGSPRTERASSLPLPPFGEGADPREGAVLGGRYRIERVLRSDAASVLALAYHAGLGQKVALRWLLPRASGAQAASRFLQQARAAARLRSEHAARVIDVGRFASTLPYVATEGSEGWDLSEVLRVRGPLPVQEAVDYVLQAAEAVAEAHALGIVHGGLNLMSLVLTRRPDGSALVKVRDFGFAVELLPSAYADDGPGQASPVLDVLAYVSPEQLRSTEDADPRSDVWALGAVLHALLSGSSPFRSATSLALLAAVAADPPLPLAAVREDVPTELEEVILFCLRKDRAERYQSVGDLALALRPYASGNGLASIERAHRSGLTQPPPMPSRPPAAMVHVRRPRENRPPTPAAAAAVPAESRPQGWMIAVGLLGVGMGALAAVMTSAAGLSSDRPSGEVAEPATPPGEAARVDPLPVTARPVTEAPATVVAEGPAVPVPVRSPAIAGAAPLSAPPRVVVAARAPGRLPAPAIGAPSTPKGEVRKPGVESTASGPPVRGADLFDDIQ